MKNWKPATSAMTCALLLCSAFASSQGSTAQTPSEFPSTSGNAFLRLCSVIDKDVNTNSEVQHSVACIGYVEGVVEGVTAEVTFAHAMTNKEPPKPFCLPENSENGQLIRIVLKYIRNHPEESHESTSFLILKALRESFPCRSTH